MTSYTVQQKNEMLRSALLRLKGRITPSAWVSSNTPYTDLRKECILLASDPEFEANLSAYLAQNTIIRRASTMFLAMAARAQWQDAPEEFRSVAARGWFLGRWLPTFLIIDGPVGRLVLADQSPLSAASTTNKAPFIHAVRTFLNDRTFRLLRNGFAHWSFDWEVVGPDSFVVAYDWERDLPTAKLHVEEADAYHISAFSIIEVIDDTFLRPIEKFETAGASTLQ